VIGTTVYGVTSISDERAPVVDDLAEAPATEDAAAEVWRRIRSISHDPKAMAAFHQIAQETGVPLAPLRALLVLPLNEAISMRQLARLLGCDNSYVTALVDTLESRGLVVRQPHPTDRRVKVIVLTAQGRQLAQRAQLADTSPPDAFASLSEAEIGTLRDLLRRLDPAET
jgi:DNA-binding MarR family transcriptional regulator